MLLPEAELDFHGCDLLACSLDISRSHAGPAKVDTDVRAQGTIEPTKVSPVVDALTDGRKDFGKVWTSELSSGPQLGKWINLSTDTVEHDVLCGVDIQLLCEVGMYPEEITIDAVLLSFE